MALRLYRLGEFVYQFEEGAAPEGAVPVGPAGKDAAPANKARKAPANKGRKAPVKKEG